VSQKLLDVSNVFVRYFIYQKKNTHIIAIFVLK
jgi:hypothetical protein